MSVDATCFRTLVFDCDGVVLDSNSIKTEAFREISICFGEDIADSFVAYHRQHGGVSRYRKIEYLVSELLERGQDDALAEQLLEAYAYKVRDGLRRCAIAPGLERLRTACGSRGWMIASGSDEQELRSIFLERRIAPWFDLGIFGSPSSKRDILHRAREEGSLEDPVLFLGDSRYDHECAEEAGCEFVFVSRWSDFDEWPEYCRHQRLRTVHSLEQVHFGETR